MKAPRIGSLLVRAILRSPLHGLLSRRLMLLTVIGRRTGRRYTFPVEYVSDGRHVTVVAGAAASKTWWLNLTRTSPVVVRIRGRNRNGIAHIVWDADQSEQLVAGFADPLSIAPLAPATEPVAGGGVAVATIARGLRDALVVKIDLTVDLG
jgi:deazaflavin-dependent oxidoreductase (nitroreductase family)